MLTKGKEVKGLTKYFWKISEFIQSKTVGRFNYIAGQDGRIYEFRETILGRIVVPKNFLPDLEPVSTGFQFGLPKIQSSLLNQIITFFRSYVSEDEENEVTVRIYYDLQEQKYIVFVPEQQVNKIAVKVTDTTVIDHTRYIQVAQIHSHNTMKAFFSEEDDNDEQAYMIYGVVGNLDSQERTQMSLRVGLNGSFINVPVDYIFEPTDYSKFRPYPVEWRSKVTIQE